MTMTPFLSFPSLPSSPTATAPSVQHQESRSDRTAALAAAVTGASNTTLTLDHLLRQPPLADAISKHLSFQDIINLRSATATDSLIIRNLNHRLRSDYPERELEHRKLPEIINYFSSTEPTGDASPLQSVNPDEQRIIQKQLQRFWDETSVFLTRTSNPYFLEDSGEKPDFVNDSPHAFLSRLQEHYKAFRWSEPFDPGLMTYATCSVLLLSAIQQENWAATAKLLECAQLDSEKSGGKFDTRLFLTTMQKNDLNEKHLWNHASPAWLRMVIALDLLDVKHSRCEQPPLIQACKAAPSADAVKALLDAGANPNKEESTGSSPFTPLTPLHVCLDRNVPAWKSKLDTLLNHPGIDIGARHYSKSILHRAIDSADPALVKRILQHPAATPGVFYSRFYSPPLAYATELHDSRPDYPAEVLDVLAAVNADPEKKFPQSENNDQRSDTGQRLQAGEHTGATGKR